MLRIVHRIVFFFFVFFLYAATQYARVDITRIECKGNRFDERSDHPTPRDSGSQCLPEQSAVRRGGVERLVEWYDPVEELRREGQRRHGGQESVIA